MRRLLIGPFDGQHQTSTSGLCAKYYVTGHVTDLTSTRSEERVTAALITCLYDAQPREALRWRSTLLAKHFTYEASSLMQFPSGDFVNTQLEDSRTEATASSSHPI